MPIDLTDEEQAALIDLLVGTIEHDPFPQSERIRRLRSVLTKIRPAPELQDDEELMADGADEP